MLDRPKITCPYCSMRFRLPLGFAGETIGCPGCWKGLKLTNLTTSSPPSRRRSRLTLVLDWTNSWRRPPDPTKSAGFLETRQWALDYNPPREDEDYALALEYAQKRYEEMLNLSEVLDKKLDGLARTSLAIVVLIATVARVLGAETPLGRSPLLIWAVISFAVSVLVAIWSRGPTLYSTPLEIRDLLKVMDDHPDLKKPKTEALLASSYHVAVVGTYATNEWKARQLWRATTLLLGGVVLLVLMLISAGPSTPSQLGTKVSAGAGQPEFDALTRTRTDSSAGPSRLD
jgi:hypothetical protein